MCSEVKVKVALTNCPQQVTIEFQWDSNEERFHAPVQREREKQRIAVVSQHQQEERVCSSENRC